MSDKWLMEGYNTKHLRSRMILISTPQKSMVDPGEEKLSLIGKITSWVVTVPASKPRCFWVSILGGLFVSPILRTQMKKTLRNVVFSSAEVHNILQFRLYLQKINGLKKNALF